MERSRKAHNNPQVHVDNCSAKKIWKYFTWKGSKNYVTQHYNKVKVWNLPNSKWRSPFNIHPCSICPLYKALTLPDFVLSIHHQLPSQPDITQVLTNCLPSVMVRNFKHILTSSIVLAGSKYFIALCAWLQTEDIISRWSNENPMKSEGRIKVLWNLGKLADRL